MSKLELHPLAELRDDAAEILADRYARQRAAEPLLPQIDGLEPHLPAEGLAATRGRQTRSTGGR